MGYIGVIWGLYRENGKEHGRSSGVVTEILVFFRIRAFGE